MKSIVLFLALVAGAANADTVALAPVNCGTVKQCINVPNDKAADVDLYLAPQYTWLSVYVDGVRYYAPAGNGASVANVTLTATDGSGAAIVFSATFGTYRTCVHSGRGQTCSTHWDLTSGSIVR